SARCIGTQSYRWRDGVALIEPPLGRLLLAPIQNPGPPSCSPAPPVVIRLCGWRRLRLALGSCGGVGRPFWARSVAAGASAPRQTRPDLRARGCCRSAADLTWLRSGLNQSPVAVQVLGEFANASVRSRQRQAG